MRIFWSILLLLFSLVPAFGQHDYSNPYVDSLRNELSRSLDSARVDILNMLAYNFYYFDNDSSEKYAADAVKLSTALGYRRGLSEAQRMMGISSKAKNDEGKAIEWLYKGLSTAQEINYSQGIADNLNSLGLFYRSIEDNEQAISYFSRSIVHQKKAGNKLREGVLYSNLAVTYLDKHDLDSSTYFFRKSKSILDSIGDPRWLAMVYSQSAGLLIKQDSLSTAEEYSRKGLDLGLKTGQTFHMRKSYLNLAEIYLLQKQFEKSQEMADKALQYSRQMGFIPFLIEAYYVQYQVNEELGNYEKALRFHEMYTSYRDSLKQKQSQMESDLIRYLSELELKEMENLSLRKEYESQEAQNQANQILIYRQTILSIGIGITLIIVSILAIVGFRLRQKESETNKKLQVSNNELEEQKEELSATLQMVQHLNAQLQAQNNTLNNIAIVSITDLNGSIISVNDNFCNVTGYNRDMLLGKRHNMIVSGEQSKDILKAINETISAGNTWRGETKNKRNNGEDFWADTAIAPILNEDRKPKQFFYLQFEITERKNYLNELTAKSTELEDLNKLKDKLLSIVSHDFRSPLNSLRGTLSLFLNGVISNDELGKLTESLMEKLDNTYNLLENLLNWAKSQMQGTKVYIKEINLKSISEDCVGLLSPIAEKKLVKINNNIGYRSKAMADNEMIKLVMRNLISNAIKFSSAGDQIELDARVNCEKIIVSIQDSGTGISNENQDRIFRPENFSTVGTSNEAGMGLGLLLCKDFVEKNGGKIWFESEFEKGSTFYFTLPLKQ
jgi:PAS domain S-box-containing protein